MPYKCASESRNYWYALSHTVAKLPVSLFQHVVDRHEATNSKKPAQNPKPSTGKTSPAPPPPLQPYRRLRSPLPAPRMLFRVLHSLSRPPRQPPPIYYQPLRAFTADVEIKFVRDRGLDHAVERENNLRPMLNLKNLIKSEPSKSLPLSTIVQNKDSLKIPNRPIEFVRNYPSIFEEFFPCNIGIHPHVRLTEEVVSLDAEEQLVYQSAGLRRGAADRLLKLLMLCSVYEVPLKLIDRLKWDLGLPDDYAETLVPEFPHYFQVKNVGCSSSGSAMGRRSNEGLLELVCWDSVLAVSAMERRAMKGTSGYQKGMPIAFPMHFSKDFEMDKKLKKLIDDWQKLPYVSPYENSSHLQPNSDESDKWAVSVLHELLHIFVCKKAERDNILCFGEFLGIRSRFKRALVHHPGIFYLSSKIGTYTVVLREAYKRDILIDKHPLMDMRSKYIHLMHLVKDQKSKTEQSASQKQQAKEVRRKEEEGKGGRDGDNESHPSDPERGESDVDEEEVAEVKSTKATGMTNGRPTGRGTRRTKIDAMSPLMTEKHAKGRRLITQKHAELRNQKHAKSRPLVTQEHAKPRPLTTRGHAKPRHLTTRGHAEPGPLMTEKHAKRRLFKN
ncbi:hypothetical protein Dimus_006785 [Dionaea muscipula]